MAESVTMTDGERLDWLDRTGGSLIQSKRRGWIALGDRGRPDVYATPPGTLDPAGFRSCREAIDAARAAWGEGIEGDDRP